MGRRVRIDEHHRPRPQLTVENVDPGLGPTPGLGPLVTWTPPVFEGAETLGAAAAVRAIEASRAAGREPAGATALAVVPEGLPVRVLRAIHQGAESTWHALGVPMVPARPAPGPLRFGFAVQARPPKRAPRRGARPGDAVFLSRGLGSDVLVEAYERGRRSAAQTRSWIEVCTQVDPGLPRRLAGAGPAMDLGPGGLVRACLDIAQAWDLDVVVDSTRLPGLAGVTQHLLAGLRPPSAEANRRLWGSAVSVARGVSEVSSCLAFGAEWTGGVIWVDDGRHGPGIGELRRKRGRRPAVRLMAELDLRGTKH